MKMRKKAKYKKLRMKIPVIESLRRYTRKSRGLINGNRISAEAETRNQE